MSESTHEKDPAGERPGEATRTFSVAGKLAGILTPALLAFGGLAAAGIYLTELPPWLVLLLAFGTSLPIMTWLAGRYLRPLVRTIRALSDGIRSFRDRDFSMRIATHRRDELGELVRLYNTVGEILREERAQIRQRELLLQTALDRSPIAIVLVNALDRVVYANHEARRLFVGGGRLGGRHFSELLADCPRELRQVLDSGEDGMFTIRNGDEFETYHLSERSFLLNRQHHSLFLLRRMTAELARQEAEIWKKVIRVISHELNNSLAPISSLAHSGRLIARNTGQAAKLEPIYESIRERVDHLTNFLEGYARYARLPKPKKESVSWERWLEPARKLFVFELAGELPSVPGYFDPSQLQQVLINLLKNAIEASEGEPRVTVRIDRLPDGVTRCRVTDQGRGMSEEVLRQALLPFYSTKPAGTGVGLPLCREIIEAHGGSLRIQSREAGGTTVSFWLPPPSRAREPAVPGA